MRLLISPQEFKGTLSAIQVATTITATLQDVLPGVEVDLAPLADGGPGTVDALAAALGGEHRSDRVQGPLGRSVDARWAYLAAERTAIIEMAAASGLTLLRPEERDPLRASTHGTGELIARALDEGCRRIVIGLGGSATNDGGAGAATALGVRFLDTSGAPLPSGGAALKRLARIDVSSRDVRLAGVELLAATDVHSPLLGPAGATFVFGPQKGADPPALATLETALSTLEATTRAQLGVDVANLPGSGAAGGLGYGLAAFCGGRLTGGFEMIARVLELERRAGQAEVVVTGEGRLDSQTARGKGPWALAALARRLGKRTVLFAGSVEDSLRREDTPFDEIHAVSPPGLSPEQLIAGARPLLRQAVERWARGLLPCAP